MQRNLYTIEIKERALRAATGPRFAARERLAFLGASHGLTGELLSAWCRTKGLFERELV